MATIEQKPAYGRRLIAHLIDERAEYNPGGIAFSIQRSADIKQGFRDTANSEISSAISKAAHWIEKALEQVKPYPLSKTLEQARLEPFVVPHASGSTGLPKPVVVAQGTMATGDGYLNIPSLGHEPAMVEIWKNERVFLGIPLFHVAGQLCLFSTAMPCSATLVLGPPEVPVTDEMANAVHVHGNVNASLLAPSLLEEIAKAPSYLKTLNLTISQQDTDSQKDAGDSISAPTTVHSFLGATETGMLPIEVRNISPEDWQYLKFSPCLGAEFRPYEGEQYELVIVRTPKYEHVQGAFSTFPGMKEYSMKDVYSKHPSKPDLWRFEGRTDDVIIFSNSEKLNPVTMEGIIGGHPEVLSALIIGTGYFQPSLLIEAKKLPPSDTDQAKLRESIWPYVERANQDCPDYAVVSKDLVISTPANKPMLRAGKETVRRKATAAAFKQEIDRVFAITWINTRDQSTLRSTLHDIVAHELTIDKFVDDTYFQAIGMDSLHFMNLVRKINSSLDHSDETHVRVSQHTVYYNPSINKLAAAVKDRANQGAGLTMHAPGARIEDRTEALPAANTAHLPITARAPIYAHERRKTVILTGSTGSLGSYLLDGLLADKDVVEVVCFERVHRGSSALDRQKQAMRAHGLSVDISPQRVSFVEVDLSQPYFGLSRSAYMELLRTVTHILLDAWEVNLELPLESSIPTRVHGIRQFVDFSAQSHHDAFIFFISSLSSVSRWPISHHEAVPEQIIEDWSVAGDMGYAKSELLSERILASASCLAGVPTATCRVVQIAGPTTRAGMWSKQEWFPSLVASSKYLNMIPETLAAMDTVDWIPVDLLARALVELLMKASLPGRSQDHNSSTSDGSPKEEPTNAARRNGGMEPSIETQIFHTTNPLTTSYSKTLLPSLLAYLPHDIKRMPFAEWVSAI